MSEDTPPGPPGDPPDVDLVALLGDPDDTAPVAIDALIGCADDDTDVDLVALLGDPDDTTPVAVDALIGCADDITDDLVLILIPPLPRAVDEDELERRQNNDYR